MVARGTLHPEVCPNEREAIAEAVTHEIMLHFPDVDREQALNVGWSVLPRLIRDLGATTIIETADALGDAMRPRRALHPASTGRPREDER